MNLGTVAPSAAVVGSFDPFYDETGAPSAITGLAAALFSADGLTYEAGITIGARVNNRYSYSFTAPAVPGNYIVIATAGADATGRSIIGRDGGEVTVAITPSLLQVLLDIIGQQYPLALTSSIDGVGPCPIEGEWNEFPYYQTANGSNYIYNGGTNYWYYGPTLDNGDSALASLPGLLGTYKATSNNADYTTITANLYAPGSTSSGVDSAAAAIAAYAPAKPSDVRITVNTTIAEG